MTKIILPELGEGVTKATIACWHANIGSSVKEGQDLLEVVTDKASFNIEAPGSGILKEILVPAGREAKINDTLGLIA